MCNFNEEMLRELKDLNLGGKVIQIRNEDKGTGKDWAELEARIAIRTHENDIMMEQSILNAKDSLSLG